MTDYLTIETPEQIPLEFPLAGIGSRFLALLLDTFIQLSALCVLFIIAMVALPAGFSISNTGGLWVAAGMLLFVFLIQFGYFAFFEAIWNGQTPGKRFVHLRVIKECGRPVSAYESITRNLLRIIDSVPGIYAVGIVTALLSARNKRLGDYVAGTVVVHERPLAEHAETSLSREPEKPPATPPLPAHVPGSVLNLGTALLPKLQPRAEPLTKLPSGCDVSRLSGQEFELIEAFLLRRRQLAPDVRMQMARKITDRVATKLEVSEEDQRVPERLLELVAAEYRNRARFR